MPARPYAAKPMIPATGSSSAAPHDEIRRPRFSPALIASPESFVDDEAAPDAAGADALAASGGGIAAWLAAAANARAPPAARATRTRARRYERSTGTSRVGQGWVGKAWTAVTYQRSVRTTPSSYVSV